MRYLEGVESPEDFFWGRDVHTRILEAVSG